MLLKLLILYLVFTKRLRILFNPLSLIVSSISSQYLFHDLTHCWARHTLSHFQLISRLLIVYDFRIANRCRVSVSGSGYRFLNRTSLLFKILALWLYFKFLFLWLHIYLCIWWHITGHYFILVDRIQMNDLLGALLARFTITTGSHFIFL